MPRPDWVNKKSVLSLDCKSVAVTMLSLLLLLLPVLAQGEGPVACLESGACFQVTFVPLILCAGLLWKHIVWAAVCFLPRNSVCGAANRKQEVVTNKDKTHSHVFFRFVAPEPHHPEEGLWDVSAESTIACPRKSDWYDPAWEVVGEEDCLFLNVYSPENHQQSPLPVMVWIHGGALVTGSGTYQEHGPQHLLDKWVTRPWVFSYSATGRWLLSPSTIGLACLDSSALALTW